TNNSNADVICRSCPECQIPEFHTCHSCVWLVSNMLISRFIADNVPKPVARDDDEVVCRKVQRFQINMWISGNCRFQESIPDGSCNCKDRIDARVDYKTSAVSNAHHLINI